MSIAPVSSSLASGSLMATAATGMQRATAAVEAAGIGVVEAFGVGTSGGRVPGVDRVELSSAARANSKRPAEPAEAMIQLSAAKTQYSAAAAFVKAADEVSGSLIDLLA
jgi:hypothetical protein